MSSLFLHWRKINGPKFSKVKTVKNYDLMGTDLAQQIAFVHFAFSHTIFRKK